MNAVASSKDGAMAVEDEAALQVSHPILPQSILVAIASVLLFEWFWKLGR